MACGSTRFSSRPQLLLSQLSNAKCSCRSARASLIRPCGASGQTWSSFVPPSMGRRTGSRLGSLDAISPQDWQAPRLERTISRESNVAPSDTPQSCWHGPVGRCKVGCQVRRRPYMPAAQSFAAVITKLCTKHGQNEDARLHRLPGHLGIQDPCIAVRALLESSIVLCTACTTS